MTAEHVVEFSKDADKTMANPGDDIIYTMKYKNVGTGDVTKVKITDTIPDDVDFASPPPDHDSVSGNTYTLDIGYLASGSGGTTTIIVKVKAGTPDERLLHNEAVLHYADADGNECTPIARHSDVKVTAPVVYAVADTHLGLRESRGVEDNDEPAIVTDFLRWLEALPQKGGEEFWVLERDAVVPRRLHPASHLVLLGDILELWDAENQAILLSSVPVATVLETLKAEKTYVLGNHDIILETLTRSYPFGTPGLNVVEDVYPKPEEGSETVRPLQIGTRGFLFIHGHQFDPRLAEAGHSMRVLGVIRQFGAALGDYAWLFFGLWLMTLLVQLLGELPLWGWILVLGLLSLWFPRAYMWGSRRYWRWRGTRYGREKAFEGFQEWWNGFHGSVGEADDLGIVYGHTHFMDWVVAGPRRKRKIEPSEAERKLVVFLRRLGRRRHTLYNISSWVSTKSRFEKVIRGTIFYADKRGPLLLGWDWRSKRPFHIPFEFVQIRRSKQILGPSEVAIAKRLGWPLKLVKKWEEKMEGI